jgi:histone acetyltransferase SAS3
MYFCYSLLIESSFLLLLDTTKWKCPSCVENGLEPDSLSEEPTITRRGPSAAITRDLLPSSRGTTRPNSHSVFSQLIVDSDPLDGSRLLRKRRAEDLEAISPDSTGNSKRQRRSESADEDSSSESASEDGESDSNLENDEGQEEEDDGEDDGEESSSESDGEGSDEDAEGEDDDEMVSTVPLSQGVRKSQQPIPLPDEPDNADEEEGDDEDEAEAEEDQEVADAEEIGAESEPVSAVVHRNQSPPKPPPPRRRGRQKQLVTILKRGKNKRLVLAFRLNGEDLARIQPRANPWTLVSPRSVLRSQPIPYTISNYPISFPSFHEREVDESKSKPYGGILSEADADTSKTYPQSEDRARFEKARQEAEEEWKEKDALAAADSNEINIPSDDPGENLLKAASKIKCVNFGGFEIDTWYAAPYPEEYSRNRVLYICEFCLKYMASSYVAWRHKVSLKFRLKVAILITFIA